MCLFINAPDEQLYCNSFAQILLPMLGCNLPYAGMCAWKWDGVEEIVCHESGCDTFQ